MKKPKILFYDIETAPNLGWVWGRYDQTVLHFKKERTLLSFAYKWAGSKVRCSTVEGDKSDKGLCLLLKGLFNEADIVVGHNADEFDNKIVRARMLYHKIKPHKVLTTVDTKKVAKGYFNFNSNSLKDLAKYLDLTAKLDNSGIDLWLGCMKDNPKSWREMVKYNKRDVVVLEEIYNRFLPWINNHPNIAHILNPEEPYGKSCPTCASNHIQARGYKATAKTVQRQYSCMKCGRWFLTTIKARSK